MIGWLSRFSQRRGDAERVLGFVDFIGGHLFWVEWLVGFLVSRRGAETQRGRWGPCWLSVNSLSVICLGESIGFLVSRRVARWCVKGNWLEAM